MNREEKLKLYWEAKEAYYNGEEIMSDLEFDQLEKELGLENKAAVGARHNPTYTVKHPFVMGSLSKVQIHKDNEGNIDWAKYAADIIKYIFKNKARMILATPKYDGCSFESIIENGKIESISSRGDGEYGKDLRQHLETKVQPNVELLNKQITTKYSLRGEVLVDKDIFQRKYSEFTNPRSFVSGVLNRDYSEDTEFQEMLNDLSIVIYDIRINENGNWIDKDWDHYNYIDKPKFSTLFDNLTPEYLGYLYERFNEYRHDQCKFALDGIVLKPTQEYRENNLTEHRPKDCVAVKFIPMLEETEVVNITWNLGKTQELTPIIWVNPVEMDGRMVTKCSGHNYGYLLEHKVSIGSKIVMSLAGDIIPFLYKVTNTDQFNANNINVPENTYIEDRIHLMKKLTDKEIAKLYFTTSSAALNIPGIGSETASKIFDLMYPEVDESTMDFFGEQSSIEYIDNILEMTPNDIEFYIGGKNGKNAKKAFSELMEKLTLKDVIVSCNFKSCGLKAAEQCEKRLLGEEPDYAHLSAISYEWVEDINSVERYRLVNILAKMGRTIDDFKKIYHESNETKTNQIPIIMTGEPTTCQTKGEFLRLHPEYRNTGSWKEVQIVFTNSMDSNTGKMKKAREKNIEIRLY